MHCTGFEVPLVLARDCRIRVIARVTNASTGFLFNSSCLFDGHPKSYAAPSVGRYPAT